MNPEIPQEPSEDFESQLTAYLLGELDGKRAAAVVAELDKNPALQKLKTELEFTMGLVREVIQNPANSETSPMNSERAQLSEARRNSLLAALRQAPILSLPKSTARQDSLRWMIPMAVAAALVGLLSLQEFSLNSILPQAGIPPESSPTQFAAFKDQTRAYAQTESAEKLELGRKQLTDLAEGNGGRGGSGRAPVPAPAAVPSEPPTSTTWAFTRNSGANAGKSDAKAPADYFFEVQAAQGSVAKTRPLSPTIDNGRVTAGDIQTRGTVTLESRNALQPALGIEVGRELSHNGSSPASPTAGTLLHYSAKDSLSAAVPPPEAAIRLKESEPNFDSSAKLRFVVPPNQPQNLAQESLARSESLSKKKLGSLSAIARDAASERPLAEALIGQADSTAEPTPQLDVSAESKQRGEISTAGVSPFPTKSDSIDRFGAERSLSTKGESESLKSVPPADADTRLQIVLAATDKEVVRFEETRGVQKPQSAPVPQPEVSATENAFSTFSLNVTDVSFKLAASSLENNALPDSATIRSEEFINAFQYRDPEPASGQPMAFAWDRAASPFSQNRELLRFSLKTAALGRESGRSLNLVLLLDKSGSMERPDRVETVRGALVSLGQQLKIGDRLSVVTFARTPRLLAEAVPTDAEHVQELASRIARIPAEGGTNLEEAMKLAYATALKHFQPDGLNRVVLLTDGAANLGEVEPTSLQALVESWRLRGVALDCFGVGWEGLNDPLLATLASHGDGRYGLINTPEEAVTTFASQLAGALQVAAANVKVQVEFNPQRVTTWRQFGYATHQLAKEQFRDNRVDAAELAAAESGNALYTIQVNSQGSGPIATVRARFRDPVANVYRELSWTVPFSGTAESLNSSAPRMRLTATAALFSEWLAQSPHAAEVTPTRLLSVMQGVPESFSPDPLPKKLESMIRQAQSLTGK